MFPGGEYAEHGFLLTLLALSFVAGPVGYTANVALTCAEKSREVAAVSTITLAAGVGLIAIGMAGWGLVGAAFGVLATETLNAAILWSMLHCVLRDETGAENAGQPARQAHASR
jgi:O-antigen/teichoic acid export membrane protein